MAYQSILIANENLIGLKSALDKAAVLEHYSGAELTLLEAIYDDLEKESDSILPRSEKEQLIAAYMKAERHSLAELANNYGEKVNALNVAVSWSEDRELGICRYALKHHADLIIKPLDTSRSIGDMFHHSSVHRLLAYAACPVLVSQVSSWDNNKSVLACVDVSDSGHISLNESIVQQAWSLATLLNVPLHLLNVAPLPQLSLGQFSSTFDVSAMQERMLASRGQEMQRLKAGVKSASKDINIHIKSGSLVNEVRSLVDDIGANIVVMGTASREGLRRFLIGNSAESVLYRLATDMLFVKENWLDGTEYGD